MFNLKYDFIKKLFYFLTFVVSLNLFCMESGCKRKAQELESERPEKKQEVELIALKFEDLPNEIIFPAIIDKSLQLNLKDKSLNVLLNAVIENYTTYVRLKRVNHEWHDYLDNPDDKTHLTGYQRIIFKHLDDEGFERLNNYVFDTVAKAARAGRLNSELEKKIYILLEFLISLKKFEPNLKNNLGQNLLTVATRSAAADIVKLLLKNKIFNINAKDNNGLTALMEAADWGHKNIAKLLIDAGADVSIKNSEGRTARDIAEQKNHQEIVDLLDIAWSNQCLI